MTSRLITSDNEAGMLTIHGETDARTAMSRGLAEYLRDLSLVGPAGRDIKFLKVYDSWAELESTASYPSAAVYANERGMYGGEDPSPSQMNTYAVAQPTFEKTGQGFFIQSPCELVQTFVIDVWATDNVQRRMLVSMIETAFLPVDWMLGFRLELAHYYGLRATYDYPSSVDYIDNDSDKAKRYARALFSVQARVPVAVVRQFVTLKPRIPVDDGEEPAE
jgi:hypothetical protein